MLFREISCLQSQNPKKHKLCGWSAEFGTYSQHSAVNGYEYLRSSDLWYRPLCVNFAGELPPPYSGCNFTFRTFTTYCRFPSVGRSKFRGSGQLYIRGADLIFVPGPLNPRPSTRLRFSYHGKSHATCQDGLFPTYQLRTSQCYFGTDCIYLCHV